MIAAEIGESEYNNWIVPKYPFSRDERQYIRLVRILSFYRLSLGQTRQEQLLEYLLQNIDEDKINELKELFMNLSPYYSENCIKE